MIKMSYSKHLKMFRAEISLDESDKHYKTFIFNVCKSSRLARVAVKKQFMELTL